MAAPGVAVGGHARSVVRGWACKGHAGCNPSAAAFIPSPGAGAQRRAPKAPEAEETTKNASQGESCDRAGKTRHTLTADGVEVGASPASPLAVLASGSLADYWRFHQAVAKAQFAAWLREPRKLLIDITGPLAATAAQAAAAGHTVIQVIPAYPGVATPEPAGLSTRLTAGHGLPRSGPRGPGPGHAGKVVPVIAEAGNLAFLADGCADGVIAEDGALSRHLMTEDVAAEIARVLRPGGRLIACVDSLVLGMAILAEQHQWAHLVDLPQAEVVLIPWPDGTITRCFGAAQLKDLLSEAGLEVNWVRPRTVLSPSMVDHVLRREPGAIARLVRAELEAGQDSSASVAPEESFGIRLLAAAHKAPAPQGRTSGRGVRRRASRIASNGR